MRVITQLAYRRSAIRQIDGTHGRSRSMRSLWLMLVFATPQMGLGATGPSAPERYVAHYASQYRVPPELIAALIDVESRWNPNALSNKGAMGLMQLMPATARRFGAFQPFDEEQNIAAGTRYVTTLIWEFRGDLRLVSAAYYAGDYWIGKKQPD